MTAKIIDGKALAQAALAQLKTRASALSTPPHLTAVQVGENSSSRVYLQRQRASCEEIGIRYTLDELPADTTQARLVAHIQKLNAAPDIHGIILQMPLPDGLDDSAAQQAVAPAKDVEGMTAANMGGLICGTPNLPPCTAEAAYRIVKSLGLELRGKEVVIVGRSAIVGKPLMLLLLGDSVTPTICHTGTADLAAHTSRADILVAAAGRAGLVTADMVKPGAVVIDVGINRVPVLDDAGQPVLNENGKKKMRTVGDVDFDAVSAVAGRITPVPGGVGPMTVAMLLKNTVASAERAQQKK